MAGCILPGTPVHQIKRCPQHYAVSIDSCTNVTQPTGNLDSRTSAEVMGLLQMTSREFNQTIIMITHNEEIAQLADRIIHLEDGRVVGGDIHVSEF